MGLRAYLETIPRGLKAALKGNRYHLSVAGNIFTSQFFSKLDLSDLFY